MARHLSGGYDLLAVKWQNSNSPPCRTNRKYKEPITGATEKMSQINVLGHKNKNSGIRPETYKYSSESPRASQYWIERVYKDFDRDR